MKYLIALLLCVSLSVPAVTQDLLWFTDEAQTYVAGYYKGKEYVIFYKDGTVATSENVLTKSERLAAYQEFVKMFKWNMLDVMND